MNKVDPALLSLIRLLRGLHGKLNNGPFYLLSFPDALSWISEPDDGVETDARNFQCRLLSGRKENLYFLLIYQS